MIEVCFCEKAHFYFTPPLPSQSKLLFFWWVEGAGGVEDGEDHYAYVGEYGEPKGG